MKRRKFDPPSSGALLEAYAHNVQLKPRYHSANNLSAGSSVKPLHQQQQRAAAPSQDALPAPMEQYQLGPQDRPYISTRGVAPRTSGSSASYPGVGRDQGYCPSPNINHHYDQLEYKQPRAPFQHAQHPTPGLPTSSSRSTSSSLQILASSALSTSFSSMTTTTSSQSMRSVENETPLFLPRVSTMIPLPSNPSACGTTRWIPTSSQPAHLPTLIEKLGSHSNATLSPPWSSEMTMMSPTKWSRAAGYISNQRAAAIPTWKAPAATGSPSLVFGSSPPPFVIPSEERIANPDKNSRYLREMDRREIIQRIQQGEKQAALAKEYQVSRAAICSLNKHREDVMLRKDTNPLAKHPKKLKSASSALKAANRKLPLPRLGKVYAKTDNTHEVKSRAAALLLTSLRNKNTTMSEFRRSSDRLVRLVLEEALSLVPIKAVEVHLSDDVKADGMGWEYPPCAISMENQQQQFVSNGVKPASPLLDLFRALEPDQPTARASVVTELDHQRTEHENVNQSKTQQVNFVDAHLLPTSLKYHNVFVFDIYATSFDSISAVVRKLLERGAVEAMIYLAVLFIDSDIIASVHKRYPGVKIVATQIDPNGIKPPSPSSSSSSSSPGVNSKERSIGGTNEETAQSIARQQCCMEFVLNRLLALSKS